MSISSVLWCGVVMAQVAAPPPATTPSSQPVMSPPAAPAAGQPAGAAAPDDAAALLTASTLRVRVLRQRTAEGAPADVLAATAPIDGPRMSSLTVDMLIDAPKDAKLAFVNYRAGEAKDNTGKDLIQKLIMGGDGEKGGGLRALRDSIVPLDHASVVRWTLDAPAGDAKTVNLSMHAAVGLASGTDRIELAESSYWKPIAHPSLAAGVFGPSPVEYKFIKVSDRLYQLGIRPGRAADVIFRVDPRNTPKGQRQLPSGRDKEGVYYLVDRAMFPDEPLSIQVFKDVKVRPLVVDLKDVTLP